LPEIYFWYTEVMFIVARKTDIRVRKVIDNSPIGNDNATTILKGISLDFIEVEDFDMTLKAEYNIIYYVFDGEMQLVVNDRNTYTLLIGDAVFIEKGMRYRLKGTFRATTVNRTAYVE
jgi:ethanolamine utilization protein EutQ (cupin superfamily)